MRRTAALLLALLATVSVAGPVPQDEWLMMVRTENSDPAQEAAFNHWYDEIDIPDVLKVPGYMRARRGVAQPAAPNQGEGSYLALYDIRSTDIEQTIAAMNQLARDMPQQGRSTPLLRVTERIYYRLYQLPRAGTPAPASKPEFLIVARFAPAASTDTAEFDAWYDTHLLDATLARPGVLRATRYELHRVRMDEPIDVPRFLTVFEVAAPDAAAARALVDDAGEPGADHSTRMDTNVFRKTKDVRRPAAPH